MPSERANEGNWHREDRPKQARSEDPASKLPTRGNLRKHVRFEVDDASPLLYVKGLLTWTGIGRANKALDVLNLSEGGVLLRTKEKIPPGRKVHVSLFMKKYNDQFRGDGVVRWCVPSATRTGSYEVGVKFSEVREAEAKKLVKMREWFTSAEYKAKAGGRNKGTLKFEFGE